MIAVVDVRRNRRWPYPAAGALVAALAAVSLSVGAGDVGGGDVLAYLRGESVPAQVTTVVETLRGPRTLVAVMVGAALAAGGVLLQAATRNPLAETGLLGVNSGAALGVVIGITTAGAESGPAYLGWAFGGAAAASAAVIAIANQAGASPLRLLLAGVALSATFRGLTSYLLLQSQANYDQYRYWALGTLSGVDVGMALSVLPAVALGLGAAAVLTRPLGALALGDDVASALGHRPSAVRTAVAVTVTLLAGAAVALAGPIALLGLLAPCAARTAVGPRIGAQLAAAVLIGPALLLAADVAARLVVRPYEAPASVLLAFAGAPVLVWIARSRHLLTLEPAR